MLGVVAFREAFSSAGTLDATSFNSFDARRMRYDIFWSFYENTAYREMHKWAQSLKSTYGLYKYTRNIYNPSYRLGSFWQAHLMGGALDPAAGNGKEKPSALPIVTDFEPLRQPIARLWRDSNWQIRKDIFALDGAVLGDVALRIVDDTERGKVYLTVVHPGTIADVELDAFGNVKGYTLEETRTDPRTKSKDSAAGTVVYNEIAFRDGDNVIYQTLLDGKPFAWNRLQGAEWSEPYGFIPFVVVKHNDVGFDWGWSETHAGLSKFREVDDLASKTSDQIRKTVEALWLFSGVSNTTATPKITNSARNTEADPNNSEPGRQEVGALYGPPGATATPLVAPLDFAGALAHIKEILNEIERDYPELKADELRLSGTLSGRALELAQQPAADKVLQRRPNYDFALVRAQQMAISIGGWRGYDGFAGYGLDSFAAGKMEHSIGERPVFGKTKADKLEEETALFNAAGAAVNAGLPLETFLRRQGWTDEDLTDIIAQADTIPATMDLLPSALAGDGATGTAITNTQLDTAQVKQVALNGAQVSSALEIITLVRKSELPFNAGLNALQIMFGMDESQARSLLVGN